MGFEKVKTGTDRKVTTEITQYDPWVLREALHNCIAHQDYELKGRINVVEKPDELIFSNQGHFIPGNVETVIEKDSPAEIYRNPFLSIKTVIWLDKVQKNIILNKDEYQHLEKLKLIDGTYPNVYVASYNAELYRQDGGKPVKVFISSTGLDLREYSQAAIELINRYKVLVPLYWESLF